RRERELERLLRLDVHPADLHLRLRHPPDRTWYRGHRVHRPCLGRSPRAHWHRDAPQPRRPHPVQVARPEVRSLRPPGDGAPGPDPGSNTPKRKTETPTPSRRRPKETGSPRHPKRCAQKTLEEKCLSKSTSRI